MSQVRHTLNRHEWALVAAAHQRARESVEPLWNCIVRLEAQVPPGTVILANGQIRMLERQTPDWLQKLIDEARRLERSTFFQQLRRLGLPAEQIVADLEELHG